MATPYLIKYVRPFITGIADVINVLCSISEFQRFTPEIKKCSICDNILALPPVSEDELAALVLPNTATYLKKVSSQLIFQKGNLKTTVYISKDTWLYIATVESKTKKKVKVFSESPKSKNALGTKKLFDFLKKSGLILDSFKEYQPKYYGVLDFEVLFNELQDYLCDGVTLSLKASCLSRQEIEDKHFYSIRLDKHGSSLDIIGFNGMILVFLMMYYKNPQGFEKYGFEKVEPAFFEPAEVLSELFESIDF